MDPYPIWRRAATMVALQREPRGLAYEIRDRSSREMRVAFAGGRLSFAAHHLKGHLSSVPPQAYKQFVELVAGVRPGVS